MSHFWHPFSNMALTESRRVVFTEGHGAELVDTSGRRYVDATAALWYATLGHGRADIADAISDQSRRLAAASCFDVYATDVTLALADRVAALAPMDEPAVFFTSGGSDSIDTAVKIARTYWTALGRPKKTAVLSRTGAYHGMHGYGTALAGIAANRHSHQALQEDTHRVDAFDAQSLAQTIDRVGSDRVAAFFCEPVLGAGGVHPPPPGYLQACVQICRERDVLFVVDEVITGFGRTGRMFASERFGLEPDVMILAKGLTGGYQPLGAAVFSRQVAEPFFKGEGFFLRHGYTYSGHATSCAAGMAVLDALEREDLVGRVAAREDSFAHQMRSLERLEAVEEVRCIGLTAAVQLDVDRLGADLPARVVEAARDHGVLTRVLAGGALHVSPPFVISDEQIDQIVDAFASSITSVGERVAPVA